MKSENITPIIATIGRASLKNSIISALREFEKVIVVADNVDLKLENLPKENVSYYKVGTGSRYDFYGNRAWNLGAYVATTKYITHLGDDDEFEIGSGEFMENAIANSPEIDIWVPGIRYNDGLVVCMSSGLYPGNVAAPTYKSELFAQVPYGSYLIDTNRGHPFDNHNFIDFLHVEYLVSRAGAKIDWYHKELYLVRPNLEGKNGRGMQVVE